MNQIFWGSASTGKTSALAAETAEALKKPDLQVLYLGFQDRLGDEFLGLIRSYDGDAGRVGTLSFHTFCLNIVRQFADQVGLPTPLALISVAEELSLCLWLAIGKHESPENIRDALAQIRKLKAGMVTPEDYLSDSRYAPVHDSVAWLYPAYQSYLQQISVIDSADLMRHCVQILQNIPAASTAIAKAYHHIIVDHAEACTTLQWQIMTMLAKAGVSFLLAVDQVICPTLPHIATWPETTIVETKTAYQLPSAISVAIGSLLGQNISVQNPPSIDYHIAYDDREEADHIATQIAKHRHETSFHDVGIVYRSQAQCYYLMDSLEKQKIPYVVLGKSLAYTQTVLGDILGYLRLVENPRHQVALLHVLRQAPYHFSGESLHILRAHLFVHKPDDPQFAVPDLSEREQELLKMLLTMIQDLRQSYAEHRNIKTLLADILASSGHAAMLENDDTLSSIEDLENLDTYIQNLEEDTPLEGIIADMLLTQYDQTERSGNVVSLVNAKNLMGRRFRSVFVCGLEEGLFPHYSAQFDTQILAEEQIHFYRSITRSTRSLCLTSAFQRSLYGQIMAEDLSRWVLGLPKDILTCTISPKLESHEFRKQVETRGFCIAMPSSEDTPKMYAVGDWVTHPIWGEGVIQACTGEPEKQMLSIAFADEVRMLMAKYAPLSTQKKSKKENLPHVD